MERIQRALARPVEILALIAGYNVLALAFFVSADVVLRKFFGFTFQGADEWSGYVLAISTTWGLAYCLFQRGHIRIDVLYRFTSRRIRATLDLLAVLSMAGLAAYFVQQAARVLTETVELGAVANTVLRTPLWIPQSLWFFGLFVFLVSALVLTARVALELRRKDYRKVEELAGAFTESDEALSEVSAAAAAPHAGSISR